MSTQANWRAKLRDELHDLERRLRNGERQDLRLWIFLTTATVGPDVRERKEREAADALSQITGREIVVEIWHAARIASALEDPQHKRLISSRYWLSSLLAQGEQWADIVDRVRNRSRIMVRGIESSVARLGHLKRDEVDQIVELLRQGRSVLLTGPGGIGKSAILKKVFDRLYLTRQALILFVDASRDANWDYVQARIGVMTPVSNILQQANELQRPAYLIVDQLDDAARTPWGNAVLTAVQQLSEAKSVSVLLACREYEAEAWKPVATLPFMRTHASYLDATEACELLRKLGIASPTESLIEVAQNLLNLRLIAELVAHGRRVPSTVNELKLWLKYRDDVREREGEEALGAAVELARQELCASTGDFARPQPLHRAQRRLRSRGLIMDAGQERWRWAHGRLRDFFYAADAWWRKREWLAQVLKDIEMPNAVGVCAWLADMWLDRPAEGKEGLLQTLEDKAVPFVFKAVILRQVRKHEPVAILIPVVAKALQQADLATSFFDGLNDPRWLRPLRKAGTFDALSRTDEDGRVQFAMVLYVARMASRLPREVAILIRASHTKEPHVRWHLMKAAVSLPPEFSGPLIPKLLSWVGWQWAEARLLAQLMVKMAEGGRRREALKLLHAVTEWRLDGRAATSTSHRVEPEIAVVEYESIMEEHAPKVAQALPTETHHTLAKRLRQAIEVEDRASDYSYMWRKAIEVDGNSYDEYKDSIVGPLRDSLERLAEIAPEQADDILTRYVRHRYSIFRRLALHVLRINPLAFPHLVRYCYLRRGVLNDHSVEHEFFLFVRDTFASVDSALQERFVRRIMRGPPDQDRFARVMESYAGKGLTTEEVRGRNQRWVLDRLWVIRDHLPDQARGRMDRLRNSVGDPRDLTELERSPSMPHRTASTPAEDLGLLSTADLAVRLASAGDVREPFDEDDVEIRSLVARDPERFAQDAMAFASLPRRHVFSFLWGLQDALREGRSFPWGSVLELCDSALQDVDPGDDKPRLGVTTSRNVREAALDLIVAGARQRDAGIPADLLPQALNLARRAALTDPDPTKDRETPCLRARAGWVTLALSSNRPRAVTAVIEVSLRRALLSGLPRGERVEHDVLELLSSVLASRNQCGSPAVHCAVAMQWPQLRWLDVEWVDANLGDLFPIDESYWYAAWDGYLLGNNTYFEGSATLLRDQYMRGVDWLGSRGDQEYEVRESEQALAAHLALAYAVGDLDLGDAPLVQLLQKATGRLRSHFVSVIGDWLEETRTSAPDQMMPRWQRAKGLWQARLETFGVQDSPEEAAMFATWLDYALDAPEELQDLLAGTIPYAADCGMERHKLIGYLDRHVDTSPREVLRLLLSVAQVGPRDFLADEEDKVKHIVKTGQASTDHSVRRAALEIVSELARKDSRWLSLLDGQGEMT
ncbi:MAG: ATP-binding protein [Armatimonadota bacterium]|nr:MAG: ATP-binding protein [Armatimonadota bacterium]